MTTDPSLPPTPRITMLGNGAWGTAVAALLGAKGLLVTIWGHDHENLARCERERRNVKYLPECNIPASVSYQPDCAAACASADVVLVCVPTRHLPVTLAQAQDVMQQRPEVPVVSLTKGIDRDSLHLPTRMIADAFGPRVLGCLSGPTIADEIATGLPALATIACTEEPVAIWLQQLCSSESFRLYATTDLIGVELGGAVKNVIAIAAGLCDGLQLGDNAKAALLTRGLVELRRLGRAMGAQDETFAGLAGIGDLITTCISPHGRNRSYGERRGRGLSHDDAVTQAGASIVEGVDTALAIHRLATSQGVEMPICEGVYRIVYENRHPLEALNELLKRSLKPEAQV